MKKLLLALLLTLALPLNSYAAQPYSSFHNTLLPLIDSFYDIGTSTRAWKTGFFDELCLTADSCKTAWPTGGGGGGSGTVGTSSPETSTYIPFWTSTGATPALLSGGESTFTYDSTENRLTIQRASSTDLTVSGTASTSALRASTSFTFKDVTGFLYATAGAVATKVVDLTTDITGTLPIANGGTNNTNYSTNSLVYFDGSKITSTSSNPLYVGSIVATSTTNTNTFAATTTMTAGQFGSTAIGSNVVKVSPLTGLTTSNSESVGGNFNLNTGTTDTLGMALYNNHTGTNRLLSLVCDAATYGGNCFHVRSDGTESTFNILGASAGKGVGKITHNSTGDADSSVLSLDASSAGYLGQGIFIDCTGGSCNPDNKSLNIADHTGSNGLGLTLMWDGRLGIGTTTPSAKISASSTSAIGFMVDQQGTSDIVRLLDAGTRVFTVADTGSVTIENSTSPLTISSTLPRIILTDTTAGDDDFTISPNSDYIEVLSGALRDILVINGETRTSGAGYVGVGTTTPGAQLSASTTSAVGLMVDQRGTSDILRLLDGGSAVVEVPDGGNLYLANNDFLGWRNSSGSLRTIMSHDSSNNVNIKTSDSTVLRFLSSTGAFELARINQSNYASFGIGTTTPGAMLSASSSAGAIGLMVDQQGTGDIARFLDTGVPVMTIKDGGNVGIGTTTPGVKLGVNGAVNATDRVTALAFTATSTNNTINSIFPFASSTTYSIHPGSGQAGLIIRTTSGTPGNLLDIEDQFGTDLFVQSTTLTSFNTLDVYNSGNTLNQIGGFLENSNSVTTLQSPLTTRSAASFATPYNSSVPTIRFDKNVSDDANTLYTAGSIQADWGGTTASTRTGEVELIVSDFDWDRTFIRATSNGTGFTTYIGNGIPDGGSTTGGAASSTVISNGGDTSSGAGAGTGGAAADVEIGVGGDNNRATGVGGRGGNITMAKGGVGAGGASDYGNDGIVTIGDSAGKANAGLILNGNATTTGTVYYSGLQLNTGASTASLCLNASNQMQRNTDAETCIASSERYKENIKKMADKTKGLLTLNPVEFAYKKDETKTKHLGFIAEQVEKIDPLLVSYDDEGKPNGIRWSHITTLLVQGHQDQEARIAELEKQIKNLEAGKPVDSGFDYSYLGLLGLLGLVPWRKIKSLIK